MKDRETIVKVKQKRNEKTGTFVEILINFKG